MHFPAYTYFGTSDFSAAILGGLVEAGEVPQLVVSTTAKPAGRGLASTCSPVVNFAKAHGLPMLEVSTLRTPETQAKLAHVATKLGILAAFGKILPSAVLELYPRGIINVHPSLLPLHRGASPIVGALLHGDTTIGVSLMLLDDQVDHGPILEQEQVAISETDTAATLIQPLTHLAVKMMLSVIPSYIAGTKLPQVQNHTRATYTSIVNRSDGQADFTLTARELWLKQRAFAPWPGLWTLWHGKRLKLVETGTLDENRTNSGSVLAALGGVYIVCGQGLLELKQVQLEGGKVQSIRDFLRGHAAFASAILPS